MRLSFESPLAEAFSVPLLGAVPPRRHGESSVVPPESLEHEQTGHGGLAGTWEVLTAPRRTTAYGEAERQAKHSWPVAWAAWGHAERKQVRPWYRQAKETKCGGRAVRKS